MQTPALMATVSEWGPTRFELAFEELDPLQQMAQADAADSSLLRLVLCAASATLVLALASTLLA